MKYIPPPGSQDPNAPYVNGIPGVQRGSPVDAKAVEYPQREILNVITAAGLTPTNEQLDQLAHAVQALIGGGVSAHANRTDNPHGVLAVQLPDLEEIVRAMVFDARYEIGQVYWFDDEQSRPGMKSCLGGVVEGISQYPRMIEYLQAPWGQARCVTQAEWDDLHVATWHTNADGSKVGWEGIGGVAKFVWDQQADTLRLPDLAGMMPEMIGHDSLGVGEADGDRTRQVVGAAGGGGLVNTDGSYNATGVFQWVQSGNVNTPTTTTISKNLDLHIRLSRVVPTGSSFAPRRWGALACVYLGRPAS